MLPRLLKLLECVLDITNETLNLTELKDEKFITIEKIFCGAIICNSFINISHANKYRYYDTWKQFIRNLKSEDLTTADDRDYNFHLNTASCEANLNLYLTTSKDHIAEWYWGAWEVKNAFGARHYLPLVEIFKLHGYEFTKKIYDACQAALNARRSKNIQGLKELCKFISENCRDYTAQDLANQSLANSFWAGFREYYFVTGYNYGKGKTLRTLRNTWQYSIVPFMESYLVKRGIIAAPLPLGYKNIPELEPSHSPNVRTCELGVKTNYKLTTPVPLSVTDDQAIKILFSGLQSDIAAIKEWATQKSSAHYMKFNLAKLCGVNSAPRSRDASLEYGTSAHYHHICYQLHNTGYKTRADKDFRLSFPPVLGRAADTLGLPHSYSLAPFAILLVIEHPAITPGFLTTLEFYDKNGNECALVPQDNHTYLVGNKFRRGPSLAEQKIKLTPDTLALINQVKEITEPLRQYLKSRQDDNWRKLFLCCGKGFGYPLHVRNFFNGEKDRTLEDIQEITGITDEHANKLREQVSLDSIRATRGVIIFLETESLTAASKELGHAEFSLKLLKSYIPKPLLEFFETRWMRVFQQTIILHALKDSPFLLQASGMHSMEEVHDFLNNHALKLKKREKPLETPKASLLFPNTEVIFCISEEILVILLSIIMASEIGTNTLKPKFIYWLRISRQIIKQIESSDNNRHDFKEMLDRARSKADHTYVQDYSYA